MYQLEDRKKPAVKDKGLKTEKEKENSFPQLESEESEEDTDVEGEEETLELGSVVTPRPEWVDPDLQWAVPPDALTVTQINQTQDLMLMQKTLSVGDAASQSSEEWLQKHSLAASQLTLKELLDKGKLTRPYADMSTGKASYEVQFDAYDINEFEYNLNKAIECYTHRIKWLLHGSKKVFGLVKGKKVIVVVDCSNINTGYGRLEVLQDFLLHLIDEQLSKKTGLYLTMFGTTAEPLWPVLRDTNIRIINEAKDWVNHLQPRGGSNVMQVFRKIARVEGADSILLILGAEPDQNLNILTDYIQQLYIGKEIPIHCVAYDCSNHQTNIFLKNLSEMTSGRYHCYASTCEEQIYTSKDISLLLKEVQTAQETISKIQDMRQGMMGNALVNIMDEIACEVEKLPPSKLIPHPPGHDNPLKIDQLKCQPQSSYEWIRQHGLKAKQLDLYQVLAPNAYSFREDYVPVIGKAVQSQVYEKAMVQFQWYDGSTKNVHVDMAKLFNYQKQLGSAVNLYEQRIEWLSTGSRRIFGTISGKNVIFLVDTSIYNVKYLLHMQHSLRLLMEQQLLNKSYFNIICFGSNAATWSSTMKKPTKENLQAAWRWILNWQCKGSRNFLSAMRLAVQNEEEIKHGIHADSIYIFTSGVPDQSEDICVSFVEESCIGLGTQVHTSLFNVEDYDKNGAIPGRYASITKTADCLRNMAHCTGGRFHWFRETGIIESDDIQHIVLEIEKAMDFSKKCSSLTKSVKNKYQIEQTPNDSKIFLALPSPMPEKKSMFCITDTTADTNQASKKSNFQRNRKIFLAKNGEEKEEEETVKTSDSVHKRLFSKRNRMTNKVEQLITSSFFLEEKGAVGSIIKKFPAMKSMKKSFKAVALTGTEDYVSTKEWLLRFGLNKLKLNLDKLVSGPACKHNETCVKILHKPITARYCSIFPSINVKGTIRHLQLLPPELKAYSAQVEQILQHYLKRLQWLLSGSCRVFGTIIHQNCVFLIDISGSMNPYLDELKKEIVSLIWEQLYANKINFNFIAFSENCTKWQPTIQSVSEEKCHEAVEWVSNLVASGNTCTLEALEAAFSDDTLEAIYLLTDGKPDTSTAFVLQKVLEMDEAKHIPITTISFNCTDSIANNFLKRLARETGGRYHKCQGNFDIQLFIHKLLTEGFKDINYPHLPEFEGDDLRRLMKEIQLARIFLSQSIAYRDMYADYQATKIKPKGTDSKPRGQSAKVH